MPRCYLNDNSIPPNLSILLSYLIPALFALSLSLLAPPAYYVGLTGLGKAHKTN